MTEEKSVFELVVFQKVETEPPFTVSLNSVPPTAVLNGVEARPLTAGPPVAGVELGFGSSHPAFPLSPADTNTLMPSAAACWNKPFQKAFSAPPRRRSHCPKLMLITSARLFSTMKAAERSTPSVTKVEPLTTTEMFAPGATAPDHWVSRVASMPSPKKRSSPGSGPFSTTTGFLGGRKKVWRNWVMSLIL